MYPMDMLSKNISDNDSKEIIAQKIIKFILTGKV